jgi:hypothetical protein
MPVYVRRVRTSSALLQADEDLPDDPAACASARRMMRSLVRRHGLAHREQPLFEVVVTDEEGRLVFLVSSGTSAAAHP